MRQMSGISPKVDIIILNYNGKEDTLECLRSLQALEYDNVRLTLVDNGSSDGSAIAVEENFPEVNLIKSRENLRFAGGNNLALKKSIDEDFDYALLLNNDTTVKQDFLSKLVETAEPDPDIGLTAGKMYYYDFPDTLWFAGGKANVKFAYMRHFGIGKKDDGTFDNACTVSFLNGACLLIKIDVLKQIGLLDEDFFLYGEDLDFCIRAQKAGFKLYYQPDSVIWHKVSKSTPPIKKLIYRYKSWILLIRKHTHFCWRPFQYGNLIIEFIPLVIGYCFRKLRFIKTN
jgi:GT2 family glycosyltransferase